MQDKISLFGKRNFDYEEDEYDRLKNIHQKARRVNVFTNKATRKKIEFDYEEDVYEPEKGK